MRTPDPAVCLETTQEIFRAASLHEPEVLAASWKDLWERLSRENPFTRHWPETWRQLLDSADQDLALTRLLRWVEQELPEGAAGEGGERARLWDASPRTRQGFIHLAGISPALGDSILVVWERFRPDAWQKGWTTAASLAAGLREEVEGTNEKKFVDAVRRFKAVELLRIAYMDCLGDVPVDQVTRQISTLADVLLGACFERARSVTAKRLGFAAPGGGFSILALGKLGGRELNYSSDIDVNFIHDERLRGLARSSGGECTDPMEIEQFFTRLAERVVSYVTRFTTQGQLYRLDARLRPDGGTGRLVWSARASLDYYYSVGRAWERQALIRMRHAAGDGELSARFREELRSFIFPTSLSEKDLFEMRDLKLQVEKMAAERGGEEREIKIGQGGIRDVEYIVQYLQLVHGARMPALRVANIFEALEVLEQEGLLKAEETDVLRRGYRFLRRLEHRLQMAHMLQTHRLPEDSRELLRLARGLGFPSPAALREQLAKHSARIRRVYRLLFEQATRERPVAEYLPVLLDLPQETVAGEAAELLTPYGFKDPQRAFGRLQALAGKDRALVDAGNTHQMFRRLLFKLLREISRHPEPDQTLCNFEDCVRSVGARSVFFQLLDESEDTLQLFVDLAARSNLVVEILRRNPSIFDEVVDCMLTGHTFDREELNSRVQQILERGEDFRREIFNFKYTYFLLTAIRDLGGTARLRVTLQNVSDIAEAILKGVFVQSTRQAEEKLGKWVDEAPRFAVLGLGKFGGQEMTYRSDVDLVFLYEGESRTDRGIRTQEYFERYSQLVLAACKVAHSLGPLLHVDLRLRPLGSHNSLAISMEAWQRYFTSGPAETWERQAFLRARPIAGDTELAERAMGFIRTFVLGGGAGPPDGGTVRRDVWTMRRKIEAHAGKNNLKRGQGGIMDVEFLVQALQLLHGVEHPEILVPNTAVAIESFEQAGLLSAREASELFNSYQFLRWIENRLSLVSEPGESLGSMDEGQLKLTIQKIGYRSTGEESAVEIFISELEYHRRKNRAALLRVLEIEGDLPFEA